MAVDVRPAPQPQPATARARRAPRPSCDAVGRDRDLDPDRDLRRRGRLASAPPAAAASLTVCPLGRVHAAPLTRDVRTPTRVIMKHSTAKPITPRPTTPPLPDDLVQQLNAGLRSRNTDRKRAAMEACLAARAFAAGFCRGADRRGGIREPPRASHVSPQQSCTCVSRPAVSVRRMHAEPASERNGASASDCRGGAMYVHFVCERLLPIACRACTHPRVAASRRARCYPSRKRHFVDRHDLWPPCTRA